MWNRIGLGNWGEEVARDYLLERGFSLLERNWRCLEGEIDLIVEKDARLRFVEVRTRSTDAFGSPEESLTPEKMDRLQASGWRYLESAGRLNEDFQFDLIAVETSKSGEVSRIEHYECISRDDLG